MTDEERLAKLEELAALKKQAAEPPSALGQIWDAIKSGGSDILRGAGKALASNIDGAAAFNSTERPSFTRNAKGQTVVGPSADTPPIFTQAVEKALPTPEGDSKGRQYVRSFLEAASGGAVSPGSQIVKAPMASLFSAGVGGMGAKAGFDFAEGQNPVVQQIISLLSGTVAGGAAGLATGPRQNRAEKQLRLNSENLTPQDWQEAGRNIEKFNRVGSTTATLPEAFPGKTSILGLADVVRGEKGGQPLAARTANRAEDTQRLGAQFLDNIGPQVDANQVANTASNAANKYLETLREVKNGNFAATLGQGQVRPDKVRELYDALLTASKMTSREGEKAGYLAAANSLKHANPASPGELITSGPQLSLALNELRKAAKNPNGVNSGGANISAGDMRGPVQDAMTGLGEIHPPFQQAMDQARIFNQRIINPTHESPIGTLADNNPITAGQTPLGRVENTFGGGNSPATIKSTVAALSNPGFTQGAPINPQDIARAIMQQRLNKAPANPGQAIRGNPGSQTEAQTAALLESAGKNPQQAMLPLDVADKLQGNYRGLPGMREPDGLDARSLAIRPKRALDFMLTDAGRESTNRQISELLMSPTKENLARLQEIAKFNPDVRKMLIINGMAAPFLSGNKE